MNDLRVFCESLNDPNVRIYRLSSEKWASVENIASILSHFEKETIRLQRETISLSDFFGSWARIKMQLSKYDDDLLAKNLLDQMKKREPTLFNNEVLNAAVFLDPRYQKFMSACNKNAAIDFLSKLYKRINSIESESNETGEDCSENSRDTDELEEYLTGIYLNQAASEHANNSATTSEQSTVDINEELRNFIGTNENIKTSVFDYWNKNMHTKPELYKLASVVHAVPPTQTTIERAFSAMALILTHLRTNLSDNNLENILMIRLNRELFCMNEQ